MSTSARYLPATIGWLLLGGGLALLAGQTFVLLLLGLAAGTYVAALGIRLAQSRRAVALSRALVIMSVAAHLVVFASLTLTHVWNLAGTAAVAPFFVGVLMCHALAYLVDVYRADADVGNPLHAALYLIQLSVLAAGPISRYREFTAQLSHGATTMGAFAYGVRRIVTGALKAIVVARTLGVTADAVFSAPPARLSAAAAWLGALCYALQVYLQFSGYSDIGIGIGRMVGLRYQENFRRPYTADSIREFWRRWNVTLITWLRDYLYLPIAGQDDPTPRLYLNIVAGFCLVGLWHHGSMTFVAWGIYCGSWLALEAIGFQSRLERWPAAVRHAYVLLVVMVGWVILRARTPADAWAVLKTMFGIHGAALVTASGYLKPALLAALGVAIFAAGPLVPSVSRWRVSIDAAITSMLMMVAATGVFVWRAPALLIRSFKSA